MGERVPVVEQDPTMTRLIRNMRPELDAQALEQRGGDVSISGFGVN
jgi:hypothetical protein